MDHKPTGQVFPQAEILWAEGGWPLKCPGQADFQVQGIVCYVLWEASGKH